MRLMASGRSYRRVIYPLTLCLASITLTGARAQDRPAQPGLRTATELIRVDFTVTDKAGRPVSGLTAKDVSVKEDGKEQAIVGFDAFANNDGAIASAAARGGASDTSTAKAAARQTLEVSQSNFSRIDWRKGSRRFSYTRGSTRCHQATGAHAEGKTRGDRRQPQATGGAGGIAAGATSQTLLDTRRTQEVDAGGISRDADEADAVSCAKASGSEREGHSRSAKASAERSPITLK